jgi:frataxin-like iron-binding protein CyaY
VSDQHKKMPDLKFFCLEEPAFYELVETVVRRIKDSLEDKQPEFVSFEEAKKILKVKKTKLSELKKNGELLFYQEKPGAQVMFLTKSLREYQKRNIK